MQKTEHPIIKKDYQRNLELYPLDYGQSGEGINREQGKCNAFNYRKNHAEPVYIMQHHTVSDYDRTVKIFTEQIASAHYVIDKEGNIQEFVDPKYRAYHAGKGNIRENSKLNPGILTEDYKNDMNSKSIGIENVNNGCEYFTAEQMRANIILCNKLCENFNSIKPEMMIGHSDWAIGRKIDPSIYFPWNNFAKAKEIYEEEGVTKNFGIYPRKEDLEIKEHPEVVLSYDKYKNDEIEDVQEKLKELGYDIPDSERGSVGTKTQDSLLGFRIHYSGLDIIKNQKSEWEALCTDGRDCVARAALSQFTQNDMKFLDDLIDQ